VHEKESQVAEQGANYFKRLPTRGLRASYSQGIEIALMSSCCEMVPQHRMPRRDTTESALAFITGKVKMTEKDREMLHQYVQDFISCRDKEIASFLPRNRQESNR
jgi:hypothetical protein